MQLRPKRFGAFMAPFHAPTEHPLLALERDLELLGWLDELGFDEAWVGEHHSAGWEYVSSPELFIAIAAQRTRHVKLGTGVVSLPYHHPMLVAERLVLLDNLTRGRVLFGVGPGALVTDALMFGVDPSRTRPMMDEALEVIVRLFTETEPITVESDWFTLRNAVLQVRPYTRPHLPLAVASMQSPAGPALAVQRRDAGQPGSCARRSALRHAISTRGNGPVMGPSDTLVGGSHGQRPACRPPGGHRTGAQGGNGARQRPGAAGA